MKKIKIMLIAMAVLSIVGGTLAFRAKKSGFCAYTASEPGPCAFLNDGFKTTSSPSPGYVLTYATSVEKDGSCPDATLMDCSNLTYIKPE